MHRFLALLRFEYAVSLRNRVGVIVPVMFFIMIMIILPFTMNPSSQILHDTAPNMIWIAVLLSLFLSLESLFQNDMNDGFIDRYPLFNLPEEVIFLSKILILYFMRLIPLSCIIPVAGLFYTLDSGEIIRLILSLWVSMPAVLAYACFGALLSSGVSHANMLIFVVTLPLIIPAIIFGMGVHSLDTDLLSALKLPLSFSLFSMVVTSLAARPLLKMLHAER